MSKQHTRLPNEETCFSRGHQESGQTAPNDQDCKGGNPYTNVVPARVLVVYRLAVLRVGVRSLLGAIPRFSVCGETDDATAAHELFVRDQPDAVVLGLTVRGALDGFLLIRDLLSLSRRVAIIVLTQRDDGASCHRAIRAGARGYVSAQDHASELPRALDEALAGRHYASPSCTQHLLEALVSDGRRRRQAVDDLSDRQLQVFRMLGTGIGPTQLAQALHVSVKTVETHCLRIRTKLRIESGQVLRQRASVWVKERRFAETPAA
jgi:DNA-binding NarL/FixJ family response regulator